MLTLLMVAGFLIVFCSLITFVVRVSGRAYPGQITTDLGRPVDYDNPYGWGGALWHLDKKYVEPPPARPPRTAEEALRQWSAERT